MSFRASDRVTGVGNRPSEKGNGLPRRFAPRNDKVRRVGRPCLPEQREALSFRASDRVTGVGIRPPALTKTGFVSSIKRKLLPVSV